MVSNFFLFSLKSFIKEQSPEIIAVIVALTEPGKGREIYSFLDEKKKEAVLHELIALENKFPKKEKLEETIKALKEIVNELESLFNKEGIESDSWINNKSILLKIIEHSPGQVKEDILNKIKNYDKNFYHSIKNRLIEFKMILNMDDRSVQKMLREVDSSILARALLGEEEIKEKIFKNMSKRAVQMVKEDMAYMVPIPKKYKTEAQQNIVMIIRKLIEDNEISLFDEESEIITQA